MNTLYFEKIKSKDIVNLSLDIGTRLRPTEHTGVRAVAATHTPPFPVTSMIRFYNLHIWPM